MFHYFDAMNPNIKTKIVSQNIPTRININIVKCFLRCIFVGMYIKIKMIRHISRGMGSLIFSRHLPASVLSPSGEYLSSFVLNENGDRQSLLEFSVLRYSKTAQAQWHERYMNWWHFCDLDSISGVICKYGCYLGGIFNSKCPWKR